jgi:putative transposase
LSHTYAQNVLHIVFSTKERRPLMAKEFQPRMWSYVGGICKAERIFIHAIGGMEDHIHLLIQIPPVLCLADAVMTIKSNSSKWASELGKEFAWQQGYGAFGVSASNIPAVVRYIQKQGSYHKKVSFQQEFIAMLKKHGIPYDPRYVFG